MRILLFLGVILSIVHVGTLESSKTNEFNLAMIDWIGDFIPGTTSAFLDNLIQLHTGAVLAVDQVNNGTYPNLLTNTSIKLDAVFDGLSQSKAIVEMINFAEAGHTLVVGFPSSEIAAATATIGKVYGVAQIATLASASELSDKLRYPYLSRLLPDPLETSVAIKETLLYYESIRGRGWTDVGVIATTTTFLIDLASSFIERAEPEVNIVAYQQFLSDAVNLDIEFSELKKSNARVFFAPILTDWKGFMETADSFGLVGESYVWITAPSIVASALPEPSALCQGSIGIKSASREETDPEFLQFAELWRNLDPDKYPGAGPSFPVGEFASIGFDSMMTAIMAMDQMEKRGKLGEYIGPDEWSEAIRSVEFEGVSNPVSFQPNGDRIGNSVLRYYIAANNTWRDAAYFDDELLFVEDVLWFSNTTEIPDLDIRPPFNYWSCDRREMKFDATGKSVSLHTPDRSGSIDDIDSQYYCDGFIDCDNYSDESTDCTTDYRVIFIVFGVLTGVLILVAFILVLFVVVFGIFLKYRRLRQASPFFLVILLLSIIVGYCSVFAWFGKPHPVACAFQPWLLGLSAVSMIAALSVKNFRIWRIFKFPSRRTKITNFELFILWLFVMLPSVVILILWMIISTPTAKMEHRDNNEHFVCATGGFTGSPGGLVFFFILVAYSALVLCFGAMISVLVRKVPSQFNETKLLAISIYNIGFLSAVIIPVFLVVSPFNPFVAWILRTVAILYAFTATMLIQFLPIVWGIFVTEKGKNVRVFKSKLKGSTTTYDTK